MSSDPAFLEYVVDQLAMGPELAHKRLFGEYGLWLDGRIVALVCDDQLLVKPTGAGRALLGGAPPEVPPRKTRAGSRRTRVKIWGSTSAKRSRYATSMPRSPSLLRNCPQPTRRSPDFSAASM